MNHLILKKILINDNNDENNPKIKSVHFNNN